MIVTGLYNRDLFRRFINVGDRNKIGCQPHARVPEVDGIMEVEGNLTTSSNSSEPGVGP